MKSFDPKEETVKIIEFIANTVQRAGFSRVVVAVSGGVDSAVSVSLAVHAVGVENVYALLLPHGAMSAEATRDAQEVVNSLGISKENIQVIDISPVVEKITAYDPSMNAIRRGNIMARTRMIVVFDHAKKINALVVGTENKTEHELGYFTRFGDQASDVEPIVSFYKTQVYELAKALGVPENIRHKAPSANLWEGQSDEGEFGFSYAQADEILSLIEKGKTEKDLALIFPSNLVSLVLKRRQDNIYKQRVPYVYTYKR